MSYSRRIIYYYQTFTGLSTLLDNPRRVSHIHVSAIHFGTNSDGTPYIHLNDNPPDDEMYDGVWDELTQYASSGGKVVLMIGGAGGAYTELFSNFDTYYNLLHTTITSHQCISGVDLDVEEYTDIANIKMLIARINADFGDDFIISMAPLATSLATDDTGLGGFCYKDLYNSTEGKKISYFNGQFYGCFNKETYDKCVDNGYPEHMIVMGMMGSEGVDFGDLIEQIIMLEEEFDNFGGVFVWEWCLAPPEAPDNPVEWCNQMSIVLARDINNLNGNNCSFV